MQACVPKKGAARKRDMPKSFVLTLIRLFYVLYFFWNDNRLIIVVVTIRDY